MHFTEWVTVRLTDSIIYYVLPFPCAGYASLYKKTENEMPILYELWYYFYDVYSVSSLFLLGCALNYCCIYGVLLVIYQHVCIIFRAMGNVII